MKLRNFSMLLFIFLAGNAFLWAQAPQVSEEEIQSAPVEFNNQSTRRASGSVRQQNLDTGSTIAQEVLQSSSAVTGSFGAKRVFESEASGFGADILTVLNDARFGHINSIRRIVAGYLTTAFEYSAEDANVLSGFILYYNARLRGDQDTVKGKYSEAAFGQLNPENIGIDRTYTDWAGRTEIIIPLKKNVVRPNDTDVDTTEVEKEAGEVPPEEKKAIDDVQERRQQDDQKKLVEKEQDLSNKSEDLKKEEQQIQQEKQQVVEEKKQVEEEKAVVQEEKKQNEEQLEELKKDPVQNAEEIKVAEQKQEEIVQKEEQVAQKEEQVAQQEGQVAQKEEQNQAQQQDVAAQQQEVAEQKQEGQKDPEVAALQEEVKDLKEKEQAREEKSPNVAGEKILFLRVLRFLQGGHYSNEIWSIDTAQDDNLARSAFTNICGREFVLVPNQGVMIVGYTGPEHGDAAHNLVMLDQDKLTVKSTSKENIFWRSPMVLKDDKIYAFEILNGQYYLSRFNPADLTLDVRSSEPVNSDSQVSFIRDKVYLTGKAQTGTATTIRVFKREDLSHLKTIIPPSGQPQAQP